MEQIKYNRSPFFYVGDKYKLMPQIKKYMPRNIDNYIEPFVGGGSSFLNTDSDRYTFNDLDENIILLHLTIASYANKKNVLFDEIFDIITTYGLSCSFNNITVPQCLKKQYPKTYYSRFNKQGYEKLRSDFNENQDNYLMLYVLLIYGFNHMIRFNSTGKFNLPVGNVDFNKNVYSALNNYLNFIKDRDYEFYNMDYKNFLDSIELKENDYIYLDPPYLISSSEYNKIWDEDDDKALLNYLDILNDENVKFGISNLIQHKGKKNVYFENWSKKYSSFNIKSNYISYNDNRVKKDTIEVFVTNYE